MARCSAFSSPHMHCSGTNVLRLTLCSGMQHLSVFTSILAAAKGTAKRQLDCGGVVTTILAACMRLAAAHGHTDLAECRFQARLNSMWSAGVALIFSDCLPAPHVTKAPCSFVWL